MNTFFAVSLLICAGALGGAGYVCRVNTAVPVLIALLAAAVCYF